MKIHIWEDYGRAQLVIMGEVNNGDKRMFVGFNGKELVYQVADPLHVNEDLIPLMKFSFFDREILKDLLDALSNRNLKTENENLLQGKLEATKLHLEDMREFAKTMLVNVMAKELIVEEHKK